jgi:Leucine-rich repeat (LRR) protein
MISREQRRAKPGGSSKGLAPSNRLVMRAGAAILLVGSFVHAATPAKRLDISQRNASMLERLERYPDLEILSINCIENLRALPDSIGKLAKLKELILDNGNGCSMNPVLPESIGNLHLLEKLVLYGAQDPRGEGRERSVQPKERHKFPAGMSQLKNLTYLDLGRNGLDEIPAFVKDLPQLRELRFQWNLKLKAIPPFIAGLRELRTLRLDADGLDDLPGFLNTLPKLTRITLGDNCSITQSAAKKSALKRRFPKAQLDFTDEYDCP